MRSPEKGFTLVEVLAAVIITGLLVAVLSGYLKQIPLFFRRIQAQQQTQSESRTAMDTLNRFLRSGQPNTVTICSCNNAWCTAAAGACTTTAADPPNSQIDFTTRDGHLRRFYLGTGSNSLPANTLAMDDFVSVSTATTILAHHVTSIMFTGDSSDLSIVNVSLRLDVPLDNSGAPNTPAVTLIFPTQSIRMVSTQ